MAYKRITLSCILFMFIKMKFLFMGCLRRTSNYLERITLSNITLMMSMADPVAIGVETLRIDNGCSLEKELTELIYMNS